MSDYQFDTDQVTQHIVKYSAGVRPVLDMHADRSILQDYGNWLITEFGQWFETLIYSPQGLQINKQFLLPDGKNAQIVTFSATPRGLMFTLPKRIFVGQPHDVDPDDSDAMVRQLLEGLGDRFAERMMTRLEAVHELVFDTGQTPSIEILNGFFSYPVWQESIRDARIMLQRPVDDRMMSIEIRPTFLTVAGKPQTVPADKARFGIMVHAGVSVLQSETGVGLDDIESLLVYGDQFWQTDLPDFLNGQGRV